MDNRTGPRNLRAEPKPVEAPNQVVFDTQTIEQLAEIAKHYNLTQITIGNIAIVNTRPDPITVSKQDNKEVTNEDILHNPYAGM